MSGSDRIVVYVLLVLNGSILAWVWIGLERDRRQRERLARRERSRRPGGAS